MVNKLLGVISGFLLIVAFLLAGLAVWERLINLFGYTTLNGYAPWKLLEYAAEALLFVIAVQLREIRELQR